MISSKLCTFADFCTPGYRDALCDIREGLRLHRKQWEYCMLVQAYKERGLEGKTGIGFAVGTEPMAAFFCSKGSTIVASDQTPSDHADRLWGEGQLCRDLEAANEAGICDPEVFRQRCDFRHIDMNHLPDDLGSFDFAWSLCALEHIGGLHMGMKFVVDSTKYLKPGGFAFHTTEYNLRSNAETMNTPDLSIYRKLDIDNLAKQLEAVGCVMEPPNYDQGDHLLDGLVDSGPYVPYTDPSIKTPHLKLALDGFTFTSLFFVVHKTA